MIVKQPPPEGQYIVIQVKSESDKWMDTTDNFLHRGFSDRLARWREEYPNHEFRLVERMISDTLVREGPIELD